jgi:AcrR family transcriptional regulator
MAKSGRRPGPSHTREHILAAARVQFADRGYTRTTLRSIADAAGVHPALLHYHFGSKHDLYRNALDLPVDPWVVIHHMLIETPRERLPEELVRQFLTRWRHPTIGAGFRTLTRDAFAEPDGTALARTHLETVLIPAFAKALGVEETAVAAALAQLYGILLYDAFVGVRQLHERSIEDIVATIAPTLALHLNPARREAPKRRSTKRP